MALILTMTSFVACNFKEAIVPDEATAIAIAAAIIKGLANDEDVQEYLSQTTVFYDEADEIWIVSFAPEEIRLGGSISIAIQKKDGKVLRAWTGE